MNKAGCCNGRLGSGILNRTLCSIEDMKPDLGLGIGEREGGPRYRDLTRPDQSTGCEDRDKPGDWEHYNETLLI